jgi:hypothetical protein
MRLFAWLLCALVLVPAGASGQTFVLQGYPG